MNTMTGNIATILKFYGDGFRNMRLGKRLWLLIIVKLLILFGVMKLFFFPDVLQTNFNSDAERSLHVLNHLTKE
jgi:hypothetical protein